MAVFASSASRRLRKRRLHLRCTHVHTKRLTPRERLCLPLARTFSSRDFPSLRYTPDSVPTLSRTSAQSNTQSTLNLWILEASILPVKREAPFVKRTCNLPLHASRTTLHLLTLRTLRTIRFNVEKVIAPQIRILLSQPGTPSGRDTSRM